MPRFRYRSIGVLRDTTVSAYVSDELQFSCDLFEFRGDFDSVGISITWRFESMGVAELQWFYFLPAIVRERLICIRHSVCIFLLLHRRTTRIAGIHELPSQAERH